MEPIVNKVAESGIITLNLEDFLPADVVVFDLKPFLFMEMILKEKDFREALKSHDWTAYKNKNVAITCSADAIIPVWAYMLVSVYLAPLASGIYHADEEQARKHWMLNAILQIDPIEYQDKRVVVKGCGDIKIPDEAYTLIAAKLQPVVKSLMYGEPCSTVPLYKKKAI